MKTEIVKAGHYKLSTGEIVKHSNDEPLWLVLSNKCYNESSLKQLMTLEVKNLPELRGVKNWILRDKRNEYFQAICKVFEKLADSERDEGLKNMSFIKAAFEAIETNESFYWLSPAHVNLAIRKGMQGAYNERAKLYGNKIVVRHITEWLIEFCEVWTTGSEKDFDELKRVAHNPDAPRSSTITLGEIFKGFKK